MDELVHSAFVDHCPWRNIVACRIDRCIVRCTCLVRSPFGLGLVGCLRVLPGGCTGITAFVKQQVSLASPVESHLRDLLIVNDEPLGISLHCGDVVTCFPCVALVNDDSLELEGSVDPDQVVHERDAVIDVNRTCILAASCVETT